MTCQTTIFKTQTQIPKRKIWKFNCKILFYKYNLLLSFKNKFYAWFDVLACTITKGLSICIIVHHQNQKYLEFFMHKIMGKCLCVIKEWHSHKLDIFECNFFFLSMETYNGFGCKYHNNFLKEICFKNPLPLTICLFCRHVATCRM